MSIFLSVIVFIIIFSVLVLIHEWGHFFAAKKAGIKVEEFGMGLPPRIWGLKRGETLYSINAIPFGGFVRLLGEDSVDAKMLNNKRSFVSKSTRARFVVIVAGVVMNFLLAILLLTTGFIFGMKPLYLSGDDVLMGISKGEVVTMPGAIVKNVAADSSAQKAGLQPGDWVKTIEGEGVMDAEQIKNLLSGDGQISMKDQAVYSVEIVRNGEKQVLNYIPVKNQVEGLEFYDVIMLPRMAVKDVREGSFSAEAGMQKGDIILGINGKEIYFVDQYNQEVSFSDRLEYDLLRDTKIINIPVKLPGGERVIIGNVYPDSSAEKAGLKVGDVINSVEGNVINQPQDVIDVTQKNPGKKINYVIKRDGQEMNIGVEVGTDGLIGIELSPVSSYKNNDLSLYRVGLPTSVIKIKDISYPFYIAPFKAFDESIRLGGFTISMFVNVVKTVVTKHYIPEGVAGPVGIAQMTYVFVQEGIMSLLRFMALLSLSLAMINILPIPAMDGGRLFFIVAEMIVGRRINPKFEAVIHAVGLVFLMLLIVAITYSDILRLFVG